jgi:glycosyltransferase involved in cell wall biosynthesis
VQRWKGPQVLCAALDLLGDRAPRFDWIGRDTFWGARESSTSAHLSTAYPNVWGKKIVPHAPRPAAEITRLQAGALFNLVPSTWDVFNFTAVEAMASGRPTIISTGAGAHELIADGQNGYIFPSEDAQALASAIERVLTASPAQQADIGRAARDTVSHALDPQSIAAQRLAAYRSTIDAFDNRKPSVSKTLTEMCRPTDHRADGDDASFLHQLPLRTLLHHVVSRLAKKAASSVRV